MVYSYSLFILYISSLYLSIPYLYFAPGTAFSLKQWFLLFWVTDLYENIKMIIASLLRKIY